MNKVILLGNVGHDPRMRMAGEVPLAEFSLATNERRRTRGADGRETDTEITEWHRIVMMGRAAEYAEKYIRKGTRLLVEGKLRTRVWEDHNTLKHSVTEIYVDSFELLPRGQ